MLSEHQRKNVLPISLLAAKKSVPPGTAVPAQQIVIILMAHQSEDNMKNIFTPVQEDRCRDEAVGLLMTYRCNLDCVYCYIKKKRSLDMSLEQAKSILEPFLLKEGGSMDIILMGGEMMLAETVIRQLVEWVEAGKWNRRWHFFGSTNGTLLTKAMRCWLKSHQNSLTLGLSYDGLPMAQMGNRGHVSEIDVDFFINTWPGQPIQMTINAASIEYMAEGVIYLLEKGGVVHPNVAYEKRQWSRRALQEYQRQLSRLADYYLLHPDLPVISQFTHDLPMYARNLTHSPGPVDVCGAGYGFQVFDVDGIAYPCHILSPLVLEGEPLKAIRAKGQKQRMDSLSSECTKCPYVSNCPTCAGCNYLYRGSFQARDRTHCNIMKLEVEAFMKLESLRLLAKESLTPEDALEVDAIYALCQFLKYSQNGYKQDLYS